VGITTLTSGASVGTGGERRALARIALNLLALLVKDGKRRDYFSIPDRLSTILGPKRDWHVGARTPCQRRSEDSRGRRIVAFSKSV